jgi:hypothetical protein
MNTEDEKQDTVQTSAHNPFPEPQTIPAGWDTSEFISTPRPASSEEVDNLAENESK